MKVRCSAFMNGITVSQINGNPDSGSPDYTTIKLNCNPGGINVGALGYWFIYPARSIGSEGDPSTPGIYYETDNSQFRAWDGQSSQWRYLSYT